MAVRSARRDSPRDDVAVVGMACRFPGADDPGAFWRNLSKGTDSVAPATRWNLERLFNSKLPEVGGAYCKWGAFLEGIDRFDPLFFGIPPVQAAKMAPEQRLFLQVAWEALEHAGCAGSKIEGSKTGVFVGASNNQYLFLSGSLAREQENGLDNSSAGVAHRVSHFLDLRGPSVTMDTTCSSSLMAVHCACRSLQTGECETALAGGVFLLLLPDYYLTMTRMKVLSPEPVTRVLDRRANGFVPGEGAGAVLLKPLKRALADHDTVYAVIRGSSANYSGRTGHITAPGGDSQTEVIRDALRRAAVKPEEISYVELSGAATVPGDLVEARAMAQVFQGLEKPLLAGSVKTNVGNLEAASGMASLLKVVLALKHRQVPPTLHFEKPNRFLKWGELPFQVCTRAHRWPDSSEPLRMGVSSFGVGGANVHLVLEDLAGDGEPPRRSHPESADPAPYLFVLSAKTDRRLDRQAARLRKHLEGSPGAASLRDMAYTLATGRRHFRHRLAVLASSEKDLVERLAAFSGFRGDEKSGAAEGIFRGIASGADEEEAGSSERGRPRSSLLEAIRGGRGKESSTDSQAALDAGEALRRSPSQESLSALASSYVQGLSVNWEAVYANAPARKIPLPTYPFERRRCWVETREDESTLPQGPAPPPEELSSPRDPLPRSVSRRGSFGSLSPDEAVEAVTRIFARRMVEKLGFDEKEIDPEAPLSDYGVDSIFVVATLEAVERETGLRCDPAVLFDATSVSGVARACVEQPVEPKALSAAEEGGLREARGFSASVAPLRAAKECEAVLGKREGSAGCEAPVAVVGMAARFPGARDIGEFWDNLRRGVDGVAEVPRSRLDLEGYYDPRGNRPGTTCSKWGAFLDDVEAFDARRFHIHKKAVRSMDPQQRLLMEQVWAAFEHAGYSKEDLASSDTGVYVGSSSQEYAWHLLKEGAPLDHYSGLGTARSILANRVSHFWGLTGPSMAVDTACSSSLTAVHLACGALGSGECRLAVAGGVNLILDVSGYLIFSRAGVLSKTGRCRIFDEKADGYVRGEGVGVVILKRLDDALRDGDTVYGVVRTSVMNHNGENLNITSPSLKAQIRLLEKAYRPKGIHPESVSYVEAGSTGTYHGDPIEMRALHAVFRRFTRREGFCALGSVKSNVGHLEAASGICSLIKVILALAHEEIPPMIHHSSLHPSIDLSRGPFRISRHSMPWPTSEVPRRAGITNFGFGGANVHLVVEEAPASKPGKGDDSWSWS